MSVSKSAIIAIAVLLFSAIYPLLAGNKDLPASDTFFKKLETVKSQSCDFSQEQRISGLKRPISLNGRFHMDNKGNLAWIVKNPVRFFCIIYNGKLTSWDGETDTKKTIDINDHPAFSTMIEMMKKFFAGKISVEKDYRSRILSAEKIILEPLKHTMLAGNVSEIEITLAPDRRSIKVIRILSANGDRSTMYFRNTVLDTPVPASVWKNGVE